MDTTQKKKRTLVRPSREGSIPLGAMREAMQAVHVFPDAGRDGWVARKMGHGRTERHFATEHAALSWGRTLASSHHVELIHHDSLDRP
jgi:hypothetical protein